VTNASPLAAEDVMKAMEGLGSVDRARTNRLRVIVSPERVREAILRAQGSLGCDHVIQIGIVDNGRVFELHYHLTGPHRTVVTIKTELPRDDARIASSHDLLPPAGIYERQIHDLFGIVFEGHPNLQRLILTEDWPEDEYPLRKDWTMRPDRRYGGSTPEGT